MTDSYHFQIEPEPRADVQALCAWIADYRARAVESMNKLVEVQFPSGASVLTSGDKIVGRVEAHGGGSGGISRAPLPNSDEWRGIGHKAHDTFGADFIVTKGAEPTAPLYDSPTTDSAYPAIAGLLRG